ncbi:MAG: hypothetical protein IJE79_02555, partial [Alphaproteobacteria bacterium]|nr:hypothetical protein [Alphaproteobacteria bacterium]
MDIFLVKNNKKGGFPTLVKQKPPRKIKSGWSSKTIKTNSGLIQYIHHTPTDVLDFFTPLQARFV